MTLDGRIADSTGHSKWITGEKSRAYVQQLRRHADALLVGANTIIADDPTLLPKTPNPKFLRLILDPNLRTPPTARVFTDAHASQTLLITLEGARPRAPSDDTPDVGCRMSDVASSNPARGDTRPPTPCTSPHTAHGARIFYITKNCPLRDLLHRLATEHHLTSILCEGGGLLAASLARENLVDRYELFYAPSLLLNGIPAFNATPGLPLDARLNLTLLKTRRLGDDLLLQLRVR